MIIRRREFIGLVGGAVAWPLTTRAQQAGKALQVGFLYPGPQRAAPPRIKALMSGIQAAGGNRLGQVELVPAVTDGDISLLAPKVAELVARNIDMIVAVSPAAVRAAAAATTTIPIVANDLESDPVASGFIASTARPGGNITGVFLDFPEFSKKWLQILKETLPPLSRVAVFWDPTTGPVQLRAVEAAAQDLNLRLLVLEVRSANDAEQSFQLAGKQDAQALLILSSPFVGGSTKLFADLSLKYRFPAITLFTDFARGGGLMAYGPNLLTFFRQTGVVAAKILQGAKPADTPVEAPTKFEFVINLNTAALLGTNFPSSILLRADEVIE